MLSVFSYHEGNHPDRQILMDAAKRLNIPAQWCRVSGGGGSNHDANRRRTYGAIAWWLRHEPPLGERLMLDMANYFQTDLSGKEPRTFDAVVWLEANLSKLRADRMVDYQFVQLELKDMNYTPIPNGELDRFIHTLPGAP